MGSLLLLVVLVAVGVWAYRRDVRLRPYLPCRSCEGSGKVVGGLFAGDAFGACRTCAGTGRRERAAVRLLRRDQ